jgi:chloramphenicol-sensitive protein RarD
MERMHKLSPRGVFCAVLAYALWGVLPLYWKLLSPVRPLHILAFRILCSLALVGGMLALRKNTAWLAVFRNRNTRPLLLLTALMISFNWGLYIWAVNTGHTVEASMGYYINPLVSIALGLCVFRERLTAPQWAACGLALAGVLLLTALSGAPPWISLALAFSFGLYGLLKKMTALAPLESLGAETLAAAPLGIALLAVRFDAQPVFDGQALDYLAALPVHVWLLLALSGGMTAVPLYCFARGARLLPLSALGFIQFISPTLQFLAGVFVFGETVPPPHFIAFACVWAAALLYIASFKKPATRR